MITQQTIITTGRQFRVSLWAIIGLLFIGIFGLPTIFGVGIDPTLDNTWLFAVYLIMDLFYETPELPNLTSGQTTILWAAFFILGAMFAALIWQIDRLFQQYTMGNVFTKSCVNHFQKIGWISIAIFIADLIFNNALEFIIISIEEPEILEWFIALDLSYLLIGLFIIAVSRVMALGVQLQNDADVTI